MANEEDKDEADAWALQTACYDMIANYEYWFASKILTMLLKYDTDTDQHHRQSITEWSLAHGHFFTVFRKIILQHFAS